MFREMRRKKQLLSQAATIEILQSGSSGVLATSGDNGYPYAVPLSYVYRDGKLFFHFAKAGHKLEAISRNAKVSFCVIDRDEVKPQAFTTHYRSVIVFGKMRILGKTNEKKSALKSLVEKYSPEFMAAGQREIEHEWSRVCVAELQIEQMTGKAALDIIKQPE